MAKIVIINDLVVGGGVENVMYNLVQYLEKRKYDITIITLYGKTEDFEGLYSSNIKKVSLERYFRSYQRGTLQWLLSRILRVFVLFALKRNKYDVVIAMKEGDVAKIVSSFKANKKIAWIHVDYSNLYWTQYVFETAENERECMRKYDKVVCVSETAKRSFVDKIGDTGNLVVKYNPIDVNDIMKKSLLDSDLLGDKVEKKESIVFVSVGRLTALKRYDKLLEACLKLSKKYKFELWLVGDGEEKEKLESFILNNKMTNVTLWGNQDNPYVFIKNADWFISTSKTESYGLAIQESLAVGTPVLAMKCPAIEECVSNEQAILVDDDFDELYKIMVKLLNDPQISKDYVDRLKGKNNYEDLYEKRVEGIEKLWM